MSEHYGPQGELIAGEKGEFPEELVVTSDPNIDSILESLRDISERPVHQHAEVYQQINDQLSRELSDDVDSESA